jgi:colanic acid/amylovoran biosynthesis glycosyltransferase
MAEMIAYLIHSFPQFSSTFVNDEVDEMRRQGESLVIFAVQRPGKHEYPPDFQRFVEETTYIFPIFKLQLIQRHCRALLSKPGAYLKCLAWILIKPNLKLRDRIRTLYHFAEAIYLYPEIQSKGCTHLHVHFLFGGATIAYFIRRIYGLTYSVTAHGSDIFVDRLLQSEKLDWARFIRVSTRYNASFLQPLMSKVRANRLQVIPFGIDRGKIPEFIRSVSSSTQNLAIEEAKPSIIQTPIRILSVGRLIWQKAQHLLLQACAEIANQGCDFHLRLVGEGPLRSALEKQIADLGLEAKVTMVGALPADAVWQEYRNADLFILSSISEGSPFVIMEAKACGLPVIAPDLHGIPEMIEDGVDGRLFLTGSAQSLSSMMLELLRNETLRKRIGTTAEISSGHIDLARSVNRFRQLFQDFPQVSG